MINKRMLIATVTGVVLFLSAASVYAGTNELVIPSELSNKITGVRIDDLVNTNPTLIPGLANVAMFVKKSPNAFFNQGAVDVVHDVFLSRLPEVSGGVVKLNLIGFVKYKNNTATFERLAVSYNLGSKTLSDFTIQNEGIIALKDMTFAVKVSLVERKVIIEDTLKDIKMIFPIGVGAFDEGVMNEGGVSLVTPRFQNGFIDQRAVITKREKPRYFAGKPFIRVLKGQDLVADTTAIGFHIEINDSFVRGFDSHGCMRLREMDLMAFHDLIMMGSAQQTPIKIAYRLDDLSDHPTSKRNKVYKTILNMGSSVSPFFIYDRDNLVQMTYKENSTAPLEKLVDLEKDNYYELLNYETSEQLKEQDARRKNDCDAKVMKGELSTDKKKYQDCLDAGKRKDSAKDRIYRKYMGLDGVDSDSTNI